jgi:hypothetical protein
MTARRYGLLTAAASSRRSLPPLWTAAVDDGDLTAELDLDLRLVDEVGERPVDAGRTRLSRFPR